MPGRDYHEALWEALPTGLEPQRLRERLAFLLARVSPGERVLDLGAGEGRFAAELGSAGVEVVAADVAEEPLRRLRSALPTTQTLLIEPEAGWALQDASFDAVWAGEVIEHVADTARWLSEARRVLRPGGRLLLSTPLLGASELLRAALIPGARRHMLDPRGAHLRFYSRSSLRELLLDFRFEEPELLTLGHAAGALLGRERTLLAAARRARF